MSNRTKARSPGSAGFGREGCCHCAALPEAEESGLRKESDVKRGKIDGPPARTPSWQFGDIHAFHPLACPGRLAQKRETGFDAWIVEETTHRQTTAQLGPPVAFDQGRHDGLQRDAVQGIARMGIRHDVTLYSMKNERRANRLPCSFVTTIRPRAISEQSGSFVANTLSCRALPTSASNAPCYAPSNLSKDAAQALQWSLLLHIATAIGS